MGTSQCQTQLAHSQMMRADRGPYWLYKACLNSSRPTVAPGPLAMQHAALIQVKSSLHAAPDVYRIVLAQSYMCNCGTGRETALAIMTQ